METPQNTGAPMPVPTPAPEKHSHIATWIFAILFVIALVGIVYLMTVSSQQKQDLETFRAARDSALDLVEVKEAEIAEMLAEGSEEVETSEGECLIDGDCEDDLVCYRGTCVGDFDLSRKTFESEYGDFIYTLIYGKGLKLSDERYKGATENAPSFDINGGGNITFATGQIDSPGYTMNQLINDLYYRDSSDWPLSESEPRPISAGTDYPVYYFDEPLSFSDGCMVKYGVIKGLNEALSIRLEDCDGNDMTASEAFGGALSTVEIMIQY
jgi:hypothetical protein